jgi:hypothetical protein
LEDCSAGVERKGYTTKGNGLEEEERSFEERAGLAAAGAAAFAVPGRFRQTPPPPWRIWKQDVLRIITATRHAWADDPVALRLPTMLIS